MANMSKVGGVGVVWHPVARCRWCGSRFYQVYGVQWACGSSGCRARQVAYGVERVGVRKRGESPFLYLPTPAQVDLEESGAKNALWGGAAGGGKSEGLRWLGYRWCLSMAGCEVLMVRRTFPELEKTHLRKMAREAPGLGASFVESKRMMTFPNGSLFEAGHCDTVNDLIKFLSSEYDLIVIDEGSTFLPGVLLELSSRARSSKPAVMAAGGAKVRITSNPGGVGAGYLKDFFIDQAPDPEVYPKYDASKYVFIPARLSDNPYMDPSYAETLRQLPPARQRQLLDGDWDVFEAQMFGTWQAEREGRPWHVADLDGEAEGSPTYGGVDWGYNQPGCFVWARALPDGRVYIQDELKFAATSVEKVAETVVSRSREWGVTRFRAVYADPSMGNKTGFGRPGETVAESHADVFARTGVPMVLADNDRYHGWQRVQDYLRPAPDGRPWLVVAPRCRYLIRTLPSLQQDPHDPDDVDTTMDDHAADALRYLLTGRPLPGRPKGSRRAAEGTVGWLKALDRRSRGLLEVPRGR